MPNSPSDERPGRLSRRRFFNSVAAGATETALIGATALTEVQAATQEAPDGETVKVVLKVNGQSHTLLVEPRWTLLHVLRDRLGFTGTKQGCERGECGACTVLIDGVTRNSCMVLALEAADRQITTVEGLMHGQQLGPVQQAFWEEDAYQCGFCTPGQICSVEGLLRKWRIPRSSRSAKA